MQSLTRDVLRTPICPGLLLGMPSSPGTPRLPLPRPPWRMSACRSKTPVDPHPPSAHRPTQDACSGSPLTCPLSPVHVSPPLPGPLLT